MRRLIVPPPGRVAAIGFVTEYLAHLACDEVRGSRSFAGGQAAADRALAAFDVAGYASRRNEVRPESRRGASRLSPYVRHGLLPLREVWDRVAGGPQRDVEKFRDELLWQEYARHWYARLGVATRHNVRNGLPDSEVGLDANSLDGWPRSMACIDRSLDELVQDGWLVNQSRMWLASHWTVRTGLRWRDGEDHFFRHLLDGSRAANRLGWQWVTAAGSSKPYGFARGQVERRAPGTCDACPLALSCPIEHWPPDPTLVPVDPPSVDPPSSRSTGPAEVVATGAPEIVWLTAESLGLADPASSSHPELPAIFVFDEPLLARLRLSAKRLVFLTETLAELACHRPLELWLGDPVEVLSGRELAVTFAPVPGFRRLVEELRPAVLHPWPWLRPPTDGPVASFSAWRRAADRAERP